MKIDLKIHLKSSSAFERRFGPSGGLWGLFWVRCRAHFGTDFGPFKATLGKPRKPLDFTTVPRFFFVFRGPRGSQNSPKRRPETAASGNLARERLGSLLGSIFGPSWAFWVSQIGPEIGPKGELKFEAIFIPKTETWRSWNGKRERLESRKTCKRRKGSQTHVEYVENLKVVECP